MSHHIGTGLIAGGLAHHEGVGAGGSLGTGFVASELAQHANTGALGSLGTGVGTAFVASELAQHSHHTGSHLGYGNQTLGSNLSSGFPTSGYTTSAPLGTGIGQTVIVDKSLNSGFSQGFDPAYNSGLNQGFDPAYNSGLSQGLVSGLGTGPVIGSKTGHHSTHPHFHHATNVGTGPVGTGYGSHETHHGAGVGGIGEGLKTFSSNVSTNPNYLNEVGFAGTGLSTGLTGAIPTTTGGYAGNNLLQNNLTTGLNPVGSTFVNPGTTYVEPHLSTKDKIKAKLHL